MSDRFVGPKLSDLEVKRRAERAASVYFYLNKGRFESIDILELLEFQLDRFAPGFRLAIVEQEEIIRVAGAESSDSGVMACTHPPTKTIYVSQDLYRDAYSGDAWSRTCLAHELGHAILHSDYRNRTPHLAFEYTPSVTSVDETKVRGIELFRDSERQAEIFAAFLLAPDVLVALADDPEHLAAIAGMELQAAYARMNFYRGEMQGKRPVLSLRPRS